MIIIATHKDFTYDGRFKDACIIDGGECQNEYSIPLYHENEQPTHYTDLHESYAELSRLYWFVNHFGEDALKDVCGLMQYKRIFKVKEEDIPNILERHGAILPNAITQSPSVAGAYTRYHRAEEIEWAREMVPKIFPSYKKETEEVLNGNMLRPHNICIMKKPMFIKYFNWLFTIFRCLDSSHNWQTWEAVMRSGCGKKTHGCLAERLSNIFYAKHFPDPYNM